VTRNKTQKDRAEDGMNVKRGKGYTDLLHRSLKQRVNRSLRNTEDRTVSSWTRKSHKH